MITPPLGVVYFYKVKIGGGYRLFVLKRIVIFYIILIEIFFYLRKTAIPHLSLLHNVRLPPKGGVISV
jgi:hypothetical protein